MSFFIVSYCLFCLHGCVSQLKPKQEIGKNSHRRSIHFNVSFGPLPRHEQISRWEVKKSLNCSFLRGWTLILLRIVGDDELRWTHPHNGNPWMFICWQLDFFRCFFFHNSLRWQICRAFRLDHDARQDCGFSGQSKSFGLSGNGAWWVWNARNFGELIAIERNERNVWGGCSSRYIYNVYLII